MLMTRSHSSSVRGAALLSTFVLLVGLGGCTPDTPPTPGPPSSALSSLNTDLEQFGRHQLNSGASAVLMHVKVGNEAWSGAFGVRDGDTKEPADSGDSFHVASITKSMVAASVIRLVEQGRIRLDGLVSEYLPEFEAIMNPPEPISVRRLLNQTSGIPNFEVPLARSGPLRQVLEAPMTGEQRLALAGTQAWVQNASQRFEYSSSNYVTLGLIVERVTGRSLGDVLRSDFFEPLGMSGSLLSRSGPAPATMVHGYVIIDDEMVDVADAGFHAGSASGGVISTVEDVNRFYSALLQGELVSPTMVKEMQGPSTAQYGYGLYPWNDSCTNGFYYGHGGGTPGYRSIAMSSADGTRQLAVFVAQSAERLTSGDPSESTELIDFAQRALDSTCQ